MGDSSYSGHYYETIADPCRRCGVGAVRGGGRTRAELVSVLVRGDLSRFRDRRPRSRHGTSVLVHEHARPGYSRARRPNQLRLYDTQRGTRDGQERRKGAIRAAFNTRSFTGQRGATITVVFDRPSYAEVQLQVRGYIRRNVVFSPGSVDFGTIRQGERAERVIGLAYAGRNDWQVTAVHVPDQHLSVETRETNRGAGRVRYELVVRLDADAPAGTLDTELTLETNDRGGNRVPLAVAGQIVPACA